MGHFGFSYTGLIFLLMLTIPNMIWINYKPAGYNTCNESRLLLVLERTGQVLVTCTVLIFSDFNFNSLSLWTIWLLGAIILMVLYELWWIRYFKSRRALSDFYSSFMGVPVAGATLPVIAFLFLGIYGKVLWLVIAVFILGIGHIGIHLQHKKEL